MSRAEAIDALPDRNLSGIVYIMLGMLAFAGQDVIVKSLSGEYAIHQIVLARSFVAAPLVTAILVYQGRLAEAFRAPIGILTVRSLLLYVSYSLWYLSLAAMPIANTLAISFIAPLIITALSSIMLGEHVDMRRWLAILAGFAGTLVMLRPGQGVFEPAALLALGGALTYSLATILTRWMGAAVSGPTMSLHAILWYIVYSSVTGLLIGDGSLLIGSHPSAAFLLRAWTWPDMHDLMLMLATGVAATLGMLCMAQAYRIGQPAIVAPF